MKKLFLLASILLLFSCTDAQQAKIGGLGDQFKIEILSSNTGEVIKTYYSTGKVLSEGGSDGYYFMDSNTGELTEISGGILIITPYNKSERKVTIDSKPYEKTEKVESTIPPIGTETAIPY